MKIRIIKDWSTQIGFHWAAYQLGGLMYFGLCLGHYSIVWHMDF